MVKKLTTFIDSNISLETRRRAEFKSAVTLLTDLYSAYLYVQVAPRPYEKLDAMDRFLYFHHGRPEYSRMWDAFDRANRVECHVWGIGTDTGLAVVEIEFYTRESRKIPFFSIHGILGRDGKFYDIYSHWPTQSPRHNYE